VARTFPEEEECTKLALLGSCAKLAARSPDQVGLLYAHVLALAAVDASYDVRDRARLLRSLLPPPGADGAPPPPGALPAEHATAILNCAKPAPPLPSPAPLRSTHMLATLSHTVQHTAPGYVALPPHPEVPPPSSVRAAPARAPMGPVPGGRGGPAAAGGPQRGRGPAGGPVGNFYASSSGSGSSRSSSSGSSSSGSSSYSDSDSDSGSGSGSGSEEDEPYAPPAQAQAAAAPPAAEAPAAANDPTEWELTDAMASATLAPGAAEPEAQPEEAAQ
jgi:hypothetical protein